MAYFIYNVFLHVKTIIIIIFLNLILFFVRFSNGIGWATYVGIITKSQLYYNVDSEQIIMFGNTFPITYICFSFLVILHKLLNNLVLL